jgi:ferritin-like metal-binding protein YciE
MGYAGADFLQKRRRVAAQPSMPVETFRELLIERTKDLYYAEGQVLKALPRMADAAVNVDLKAAFMDHLEETRGHVNRLDKVFKLLATQTKGKICPSMRGLVEESFMGIRTNPPSAIRDALLIGVAQRIEHYEIAAYGTVRAFAIELGEHEVAEIFQKTLEEEGLANKRFTTLSSVVNHEALNVGGASSTSLPAPADLSSFTQPEVS